MGTLIGGIVGAVVGVAIHVALATGMFGEPIEAPWFAIVTGLLTGLGVKQATAKGAGVSYARGGLAAIIALAGIVGTIYAIQMKLNMDGKKVAEVSRELPKTDDAADKSADSDLVKDGADEPAEKEVAKAPSVAATVGDAKMPMPTEFNPWQFVYMALGALLAYQFGRGSEATGYQPPAGEAPVAMDPSN